MNSARLVLKQLGKPPYEICLDWAWQLRELDESNDKHGDRKDPLTWSDLVVDENGRLNLIAADPSSEKAKEIDPRPLLDEVFAWITSYQGDGEPIGDPLRFLKEESERLLEPADSEPASPSTTSLTANNPEQTQTGFKPALASPASRQPSSRHSRTSTLATLHSPKVWGIAGIALLTLAGIMLAFLFSPGNGSDQAQEGSTQVASANTGNNSESKVDSEGRSEFGDESRSDAASMLDDSAAEITEIESLETLDLDIDSNSLPEDNLLIGEMKRPLGAETNPVGAHPEAQPSATDSQFVMPGAAGTPQFEPKGDASDLAAAEMNALDAQMTGTLPIAEAESIDIMQTLDEASTEARQKNEARELAGDVAAGSPKPMILPTFPMLQTLRLPSQFRVRAAQPAWKLRLEASEGFVVEPKEPQLLESRKSLRWTVSEEDAEDSAPVVLIVAQPQGSGSRALKFQIAISAKGASQVLLPFSGEYLDILQTNLANLKTNLQNGVDQLRTMGRVDGMPSEMRSLLSARRRAMENQLDLAEQYLPFVSKAAQMEGWLDGQFSIHSQFLDLSQTDSPVLLQLGDLSVPADDSTPQSEGEPQDEAAEN